MYFKDNNDVLTTIIVLIFVAWFLICVYNLDDKDVTEKYTINSRNKKIHTKQRQNSGKDVAKKLHIPWEANMTHIVSLDTDTKDDIERRVEDDIKNRLDGKELVFPVKLSPAKPSPEVLYNIDNYDHYWELGPIYNMNELLRLIIVLKHNVATYSRLEPHRIWEGGIDITSVSN